MLRYALDLYPRLDPRDGTVIRRFEHLQEAAFKDEEYGTGSGQFTIHGGSADADDIDPLGLDYIRVVEIDDLDAERVVGGFFLDSGDYEALTRKETRKLTLGGAGTLAYLQRAVMWSRSYISTGAIFTQDPIGETWNLSAQTVILAAGNHLGAMLWRVVHEAQSFQSGAYTHIHYDGVEHTGTHADDRTESAIPDVVMTFTGFLDSDGNPWTLTAGDFTAQVGESVLDVVRRLMELGLKVEMDPDTFELHAWEAPHRTDRTSGSWAANKVRFQSPTAENIDTGNILSDTTRKVRAHIQRSVVLAGGQNNYAISQGSNEPPWEGGYRLDTSEVTTPASVASRQRLARSDAVDNVRLVFKLGDDELEGIYRPWDHVSPGDLVTLHTGSEQWEYNEQTFPVAGLTVELKPGGDWRGIVELGSSFTSLLEPAFMVSGAPSHTHPPNPMLCMPGTPGTTTRLYFSTENASGVGAPDPAAAAAWDVTIGNGTGANRKLLKTAPDGTSTTVGAGTTGGDFANLRILQALYELDSAGTLQGTVRGQLLARGDTQAIGSQIGQSQLVIRVVAPDGTTFRGTALDEHSPGAADSPNWLGSGAYTNRSFPASGSFDSADGVELTPVTYQAGDWLVVELGYYHINTSLGDEAHIRLQSDAASDLPEDESSTADLNSWIDISTAGSSGDLPLDTVLQGDERVGSAPRAARCDHQHAHGQLSLSGTNYHGISQLENYIYHGDAAPTVNDDEEDGYRTGTHWIDDATGHVWILTDPSTGAAVWELLSNVSTVSDLDDLGDVTITAPAEDDTLRYVDGEWINDNRRWEAVTDGEDVFVWEGDDLVHEWNGAY